MNENGKKIPSALEGIFIKWRCSKLRRYWAYERVKISNLPIFVLLDIIIFKHVKFPDLKTLVIMLYKKYTLKVM